MRDALEPSGGPFEVGSPQVAGAGRRPIGRIREADAFLQDLVLRIRRVQPRRELRRVQQAPEVVPRIRKVRAGRCRHAARIDAAEDDAKVCAEHVGNGGVLKRRLSMHRMRVSFRGSSRQLITKTSRLSCVSLPTFRRMSRISASCSRRTMTKKRKLRKMTAEDRARRDETQRMAQERIAYHEAMAREEEEARRRSA